MATAVQQARSCAAGNGQDCHQNGSRNNLFHVLISSMIFGIFFGEAAAASIAEQVQEEHSLFSHYGNVIYGR